MLGPSLLLLMTLTLHSGVASVPQLLVDKRALVKASFVPIHNAIAPIRKQKGMNSVPILSHGIVVPSLHVIPLSSVHQVHGGDAHIVSHSHTITHSNVTAGTELVPVLIPIHNLVPVHDLTVIPLRKEPKISYSLSGDDEPVSRYRHPLGGYGAGWYYGGHGAGHGFHYAYG